MLTASLFGSGSRLDLLTLPASCLRHVCAISALIPLFAQALCPLSLLVSHFWIVFHTFRLFSLCCRSRRVTFTPFLYGLQVTRTYCLKCKASQQRLVADCEPFSSFSFLREFRLARLKVLRDRIHS